jgi:hypothetical protein
VSARAEVSGAPFLADQSLDGFADPDPDQMSLMVAGLRKLFRLFAGLARSMGPRALFKHPGVNFDRLVQGHFHEGSRLIDASNIRDSGAALKRARRAKDEAANSLESFAKMVMVGKSIDGPPV